MQPDALDEKQNKYFRRKLLEREFLTEDLVKLTFGLPNGKSLRSFGFDVGLGDILRIRPYGVANTAAVETAPAGGRAYSPVSPPDVDGQFQLMVKLYGPGGVSTLLGASPIGTEFLAMGSVEHSYWPARKRGYWCNERNVGSGAVRVGLVAFGIGITEIATVAQSELLDPSVKEVTLLWANKTWHDAQWAFKEGDDLVRQLFRQHGKNRRLRVVHLLSREDRVDCFKGRISPELLRQTFQDVDGAPDDWRFLSIGSGEMMANCYRMLAGFGFDMRPAEGIQWTGRHHLYRKCIQESTPSHRVPSPLLAQDAARAGPLVLMGRGRFVCIVVGIVSLWVATRIDKWCGKQRL